MNAMMIRCRSCTPVPTAELSDWLRTKVEELRTEAPHLPVRVSRLKQDLADASIDDGWLITIELSEKQSEAALDLDGGLLGEMLRDMRILGLSPSVLAPVGASVEPLALVGSPA